MKIDGSWGFGGMALGDSVGKGTQIRPEKDRGGWVFAVLVGFVRKMDVWRVHRGWRRETSVGLRDWSLITGRGRGGYKMGGGQVKFYPYKRGGDKKCFSHAEGGTQEVLR